VASEVVRYDDWSGGEYGTIGGRQAPRGSWSGLNMMLYRNGSVGPRAGVKFTTPSGLPGGTMWGFASRPVPGADGLVVTGTGLYTFDLSVPSAPASLLGNLSQVPTAPVAILAVPGAVYVSSVGDRTYKEAGAGVVILNTYGGRYLATHGTRLVIGHLTETPGGPVFLRRLRWSDAANDTFSAANFADAGDPWHISALHPQRDVLTIAKQNQWLVLTGSLADLGGTVGLDATIRRAARQDGPLRIESATGADERVWFQGLFDRHPSFWTGSAATRLAYLEYTTSTPNAGSDASPSVLVAALDKPGSTERGAAFFSPGDGRLALLHNGAWSFHSIGVGVSSPRLAVSDGLLHIGGGGAVLSWDYATDRPGDGTGVASQGDVSSTPVPANLVLPQWWASGGESVQVRSVIVEFDSYSTASPSSNHFDLLVDTLGPYQGDGVVTATAQAFDRPTSGGTAGVAHRATFGIDGSRGGGFAIRLDAIRGCAIRAVTAIVDIEAAWSRA